MGIPLLLFFLFMRLFAEINGGGSQDDECKVSRCSNHGPVIRFPFRLNDHHSDSCGYPGFELSCSEKKQTMLELPYSVRLSLEKINYTSQEIIARFPHDYCFQRQILNLNLSASPFRLTYGIDDFTFFNCSENKSDSYWLWSVPGCFPSRKLVYASYSYFYLGDIDLIYCRKILNATLPHSIFNGEYEVFMNWSKPKCGNCEAQGKKCRLKKSNSTEPEIECIHKPPKGAPIDEVVLTEVIFGFLHLTFGIFIIFMVHRSNKLRRAHEINIQKFLADYRALKPSRYSYADIRKITNNFKDKLGQGGYGTVYKGQLSNEVFIAVKILNDFKRNGEEFINEVGTMGTIHHINVVRLVGFCADGYKRALIYEFLPNESLDKFIFSASIKRGSLGWQRLEGIAIGIAKGIEYLHQGCDQRILHFDIKPHNILLDGNFNPKISDFGLARLCSKEISAISMTTVRGTMGYIAPEMLSRNFGSVSYKSDVYSFGMLLLEMVGGRKNIDVTVEKTSQVYFPEWLYNHLDQGEEVHIRIEEGDIKIAKKLCIVGLWCIQWHPIDRPSMKVVVRMLEGGGDDLIMPPNPFASMDLTKTCIRRRKVTAQPESRNRTRSEGVTSVLVML